MKLFSLIFPILIFTLLASPVGVSAYTGVYGIFPPAVGGPGSVTVTNFDLDTTSGPATIAMNLYYVQSITIETNEPISSHILIKEYPEGSETAFDIIVPQPVQDALIQATIYVWAPDSSSLVVQHEHNNEPTIFETIADSMQTKTLWNMSNMLWLGSLLLLSSLAPLALRRN